ncbi:hypothetical protein Tco_1058434 [Tanacetum coccineum]|uniref:Uncharacterized protein n=1 Tax=Tanacetum coccineum TaxID=301880 RepID=A0ABQ5H893_9ASTR
MKAQELKTKTSAQTLIYKIFLQRYQVYQGRLLASFQDDAKYEHVGQDSRIAKGAKNDQSTTQEKNLISRIIKTKSKEQSKAKDQRSQSMKEQAYNVDRDKDHKSSTTTTISLISRRSVTMNSLRGRFESDIGFRFVGLLKMVVMKLSWKMRMVIVMEEIYPELTILETRSITKTLNGPWKQRNIDEYWWRIYKSGDLEVLES